MTKGDRADERPKPRRRMLAACVAGLFLPAGLLFFWHRSRELNLHMPEHLRLAPVPPKPKALPIMGYYSVSTPEFHDPGINDLPPMPVPRTHGSRPGNHDWCDLNWDGVCDDADRELLISCFGTRLGDPRYHGYADIVGDGCVDSRDVGFLNRLLLNLEVLTSPYQISPADHRMVPVTVSASVPGDPEAPLACRILSVTHNEEESGHGDGHAGTDATLVDDDTVLLRAEHSGTGETRIYTLYVECTEASGNSFLATALIRVEESSPDG